MSAQPSLDLAPALTLLPGQLTDTEFTTRNRDYTFVVQTSVCLNVTLSGLSLTTTPQWGDILTAEEATEAKQSEVGLGAINIYAPLKAKSAELRKELDRIQARMIREGSDWVATLPLLPSIWSDLIILRDEFAYNLRQKIIEQYDDSYLQYTERIEKFLSVATWKLDENKKTVVKTRLLQSFPSREEVQRLLTVTIAKPVVVPGFQEQMTEQERQILNTVNSYSQEYDRQLQRKIRENAEAEANTIVSALIEELAQWEPGYKPIQFKKKLEKHLQRIEVIRSAVILGQEPLSNVMEALDNALSQVESGATIPAMQNIRERLLGDQAALKELLNQSVGKTTATLSALHI